METNPSEKTANVNLTAESWSQLRHDIRNYLNAIKLTCAVLHRRPHADDFVRESLHEMEVAADHINTLITAVNFERPIPVR